MTLVPLVLSILTLKSTPIVELMCWSKLSSVNLRRRAMSETTERVECVMAARSTTEAAATKMFGQNSPQKRRHDMT